jgi:hypothetical protein
VALITPTNFNSNAPIIGGTQGEVLVTDQLNAWATLADQKVPLEDSAKLRLMVHNHVYRKMLGDSAWVQESLVSAAIAREAREQADLAHAFNFQVIWDQQMPTTSGMILYGQLTVTNGSANVTGLDTVFTQQLVAGTSYLMFGNDPTKTQYKVSTVTSDTAIVLSSTYSGATATTTARLITNLAGTASMSGNAITGSGTAFTTGLSVGQWVVFSADTTSTPYQIAGITSATAATVVGTGATIASSTLTVQAYTNLALHELLDGALPRAELLSHFHGCAISSVSLTDTPRRGITH